MKILLIQPPHAFVVTDLPPMPGVSRPHAVVQCAHCGLIGYTPDDVHVHLTSDPGKKRLARTCAPHSRGPDRWFARVTSPYLTEKGSEFAGLVPGSTHPIAALPDSDNLRVPGVWVHGRGQMVKLLAGEFSAVKVRVRQRSPASARECSDARQAPAVL